MEKQKMTYGIAWYKPEQWNQLREIAEDADTLESDYETWRQGAEDRVQDLESRGMNVEEVLIDVHELSDWCRTNNIKCNGEARSRYAAEQVRNRHEST